MNPFTRDFRPATSGSATPVAREDCSVAVHDLWYKNAILYCLDVEKYMDANGDGTGTSRGSTAASSTSPAWA